MFVKTFYYIPLWIMCQNIKYKMLKILILVEGRNYTFVPPGSYLGGQLPLSSPSFDATVSQHNFSIFKHTCALF